MTKPYRSSLERHNAPYRGVSSREDTVNFDLAIMHDVFHILKVSGNHETAEGHQQEIAHNLSGIYIGDTDVSTNISTAGKIVTSLGPINEAMNLTGWIKLNGASVSSTEDTYTCNATGLLNRAGIKKVIPGNPGDVFMIRFELEKVSGLNTKVAIGALSLANRGDVLDIYELDEHTEKAFIEKRLYIPNREDVQLVIYFAYETTNGTPVSMKIKHFSVEQLTEQLVAINGLENTVKIKLDSQMEQLKFLDDKLLRAGDK